MKKNYVFLLSAMMFLAANTSFADDESVLGFVKNKAKKAANYVADKAENAASAVVDKAKDVKEAVSEKASDIADKVKDKASDVGDSIFNVATDAKEAVTDAASTVVDKAKTVASTVSQKANKTKNTLGEIAYDAGQVFGKVGSFIYQHVVPYGKTKAQKKYANRVSPYVDISIKIPGHDDKSFICQGVTYLNPSIVPVDKQKTAAGAKYALISLYPKGDNPHSTQIVVVDLKTGEYLRRFSLYSKKDDKYTGHAGGITVAGEYLWVASGRKLYGYKVQEILDFINDKKTKVSDKNQEYIPNSLKIPDKDLIAVNIFKVDSKASFVSFDGKYLWTGDFVMTVSSYKPVEHHTTNKYGRKTWIAGYKTDSTGMPTSTETYSYKDGEDDYSDVHKPDYIICCRESVQGMTMCDDYVVLSLSFGPTTSKLAFYKTPLNEEPDTITYKTTSGTYKVPGYELSNKKNYVTTLKLAAGSEDLEYDGNNLYVTFESSSPNYSKSWQKMGAIIEDKFYLMNYKKIIDNNK